MGQKGFVIIPMDSPFGLLWLTIVDNLNGRHCKRNEETLRETNLSFFVHVYEECEMKDTGEVIEFYRF